MMFPASVGPARPRPEAPAATEGACTRRAEAGELQAALPEQPQPEPAQPAPAQPPAQPTVPSGPTVRVQAVEIDGSKIFVAGVADPGRTVRGYANEILLGDAKASPDGQFLIEADRALAVGALSLKSTTRLTSASEVRPVGCGVCRPLS